MKLPDDGFRIQVAGLTLEGRSRAGNETWIRVRELGVALDVGRGPDALVGTHRLFISHVHLDHFAGLPVLVSQRSLQSIAPPQVWLPAESVEEVRGLIATYGRLEGFQYPVEIIAASPGEAWPIRAKLEARAHRASHRVPAVAWEFAERRTRLRSEFQSLAGEEIARRRRAGEDLFDSALHSRLMYSGDTDAKIFEWSPQLFDTDVAILECTFVREEDRTRGVEWQHLHADEIFDRADEFRGDVVLVHFSLRDRPADIHATLSRRCPASLRGRLHLALPEQWSHI